MARLVIAAMADSHAGHRLGLCNPITRLVREGRDGDVEYWTPELTEWQRYLWQLYSADCKAAARLAGDDRLVLLHVGDATHGTKHPQGLMDVSADEQVDLAAWNLKPWQERARSIRLIHGTETHGLLDGLTPAETHVAARLRAQGVDARAVYHERCAIGQVILDVSHHGPNESSRWWLTGDNARRYLRDRMDRDGALGKPPARVYLRGHYHVFVPETMERRIWGKTYRSTLLVLPSYCGATSFSRRVTQSVPEIHNGLVLLEVADGELQRIVERVERTDLRTEESID
jgi:hypothetical protein